MQYRDGDLNTEIQKVSCRGEAKKINSLAGRIRKEPFTLSFPYNQVHINMISEHIYTTT